METMTAEREQMLAELDAEYQKQVVALQSEIADAQAQIVKIQDKRQAILTLLGNSDPRKDATVRRQRQKKPNSAVQVAAPGDQKTLRQKVEALIEIEPDLTAPLLRDRLLAEGHPFKSRNPVNSVRVTLNNIKKDAGSPEQG